MNVRPIEQHRAVAVLAGGWHLINGDARHIPLADGSVHCCVTSPPFFGLRDYGTAKWVGGDPDCDHRSPTMRAGRNEDRPMLSGSAATNSYQLRLAANSACGKCGAVREDKQIGLEPTPADFVQAMVVVFREVRRVLRNDGVCFLNLGDSYASSWACSRRNKVGNGSPDGETQRPNRLTAGLKEKDLIGIPWMVAFALRDDGWYLRAENIWSKRSPMPESVRDRTTRSHEQVFMLTKRPRYFYDTTAVQEDAAGAGSNRQSQVRGYFAGKTETMPGRNAFRAVVEKRNRRSVWTLSTEPCKAAHFATFPQKLVLPCVLAGTSAKGCCPACGAPWRRVVEKVRVATRPGANTKIKVPSGWDTGKGGHGSFHRDGRGEPEYREILSADAPKQDQLGKRQYTGFNARWDAKEAAMRDAAEVGNRDPQRHVSSTVSETWVPGCKCGAELTPVPCTVFDPFAGAGTTLIVAARHGRRGIGLELNPAYIDIARNRIVAELAKPVKKPKKRRPQVPGQMLLPLSA